MQSGWKNGVLYDKLLEEWWMNCWKNGVLYDELLEEWCAL